jgi:hypothetical protein
MMAGLSKRVPSAKQKASNLFYLWHTIRDVKAQAAALRDEELLLLVGMVELLVEERTTGLARPAGGKPVSRRLRRPTVAVEQGVAAA